MMAVYIYNDPKVLGYRYVSPYIYLSPELAFVLKDVDGQVCGYVLAALDSETFYKQYVDEWLPKMRQLYPTIPPGEHCNDTKRTMGETRRFSIKSNTTQFYLICLREGTLNERLANYSRFSY